MIPPSLSLGIESVYHCVVLVNEAMTSTVSFRSAPVDRIITTPKRSVILAKQTLDSLWQCDLLSLEQPSTQHGFSDWLLAVDNEIIGNGRSPCILDFAGNVVDGGVWDHPFS